MILDADNEQYYLYRAKELISECTNMTFGISTNDKLRLAQILLNIVRAKCVQQNSENTVQKAQKQLSRKKS